MACTITMATKKQKTHFRTSEHRSLVSPGPHCGYGEGSAVLPRLSRFLCEAETPPNNSFSGAIAAPAVGATSHENQSSSGGDFCCHGNACLLALLPSSQTGLCPQFSVFPTYVVSVFPPTTGKEKEEEREEEEKDWEEKRDEESKRGGGGGGGGRKGRKKKPLKSPPLKQRGARLSCRSRPRPGDLSGTVGGDVWLEC